MYEVVKAFRDAKNEDHFYAVGDTYPVEGNKPTKARIEELAKGKNKLGCIFIKEVTEPSDGETGETGSDEIPSDGETATE